MIATICIAFLYTLTLLKLADLQNTLQCAIISKSIVCYFTKLQQILSSFTLNVYCYKVTSKNQIKLSSYFISLQIRHIKSVSNKTFTFQRGYILHRIYALYIELLGRSVSNKIFTLLIQFVFLIEFICLHIADITKVKV